MSNSTHPSQGRQYASVFDLNGVPRFGQALPLALQHVVAMIVGCVTPAIIVSGVAGLNEHDQVILVQAALFASAISTLLQLFPFIASGNSSLLRPSCHHRESVLPYVPSMQAIAETADRRHNSCRTARRRIHRDFGRTFHPENPDPVSADYYRDCGLYHRTVPLPDRHQLYGRRYIKRITAPGKLDLQHSLLWLLSSD